MTLTTCRSVTIWCHCCPIAVKTQWQWVSRDILHFVSGAWYTSHVPRVKGGHTRWVDNPCLSIIPARTTHYNKNIIKIKLITKIHESKNKIKLEPFKPNVYCSNKYKVQNLNKLCSLLIVNYILGSLKSNTINSKFHLIRSLDQLFARLLLFHVQNIWFYIQAFCF